MASSWEKEPSNNNLFSPSKIYFLEPVDGDQQFLVRDSVSIQDDEPFTLETFDSLQQSHQRAKTNLIIARVQTKTKFYYYDAHSLNKCLFRALGIKNDYLFRIMALNPLTNEDMIGDVIYYQLITSPSDEANSAPDPVVPTTGKRRKSSLADVRDNNDGLDVQIAEMISPHVPTTTPGVPILSITELDNEKNTKFKSTILTLSHQSISASLPSLHYKCKSVGGLKEELKIPLLLPGQKSTSSPNIELDASDKTFHTQLRRKSLDVVVPPNRKECHPLSLEDLIQSQAKRSDDGVLLKYPKFYAIQIGTDESFLLDRAFRNYIQSQALDPELMSLIQIPREILEAEGIHIPELEAILEMMNRANAAMRQPANLDEEEGEERVVAEEDEEETVEGVASEPPHDRNTLTRPQYQVIRVLIWFQGNPLFDRYVERYTGMQRQCRGWMRKRSQLFQDVTKILTWVILRLSGLLTLISFSVLLITVLIGAMFRESSQGSAPTTAEGIRFVYGQIFWFSVALFCSAFPAFVLAKLVHELLFTS